MIQGKKGHDRELGRVSAEDPKTERGTIDTFKVRSIRKERKTILFFPLELHREVGEEDVEREAETD